MIVIIMALAAACALGLVHLFETAWSNRPPITGTQWPKGRAMRFAWAGAGVLICVGQIPVGILLVLSGLPVCLAHLALVDRQPGARIQLGDVVGKIGQTARTSFQRFLDRTRVGPRR